MDRCLFNVVFPVIVSVGRLGIDLDDLLARRGTSIGHGNCDRRSVIAFIKLHTCQFLRETCVAQAKAEGIDDLVVIVPIPGVSLSQDAVLIAGLIIAIVSINPLRIYHVIFRLGGFNLGTVGVGIVAEIHVGGGGGRICDKGLYQLAGGIGPTRDHIRHTVSAPETGIAKAEDGRNAVIGLELGCLNGMVAREKNHDLPPGGFGRIQVSPILIRERQGTHRCIGPLSGYPANHHQGYITATIHNFKPARSKGIGECGAHAAHGLGNGTASVSCGNDKIITTQ